MGGNRPLWLPSQGVRVQYYANPVVLETAGHVTLTDDLLRANLSPVPFPCPLPRVLALVAFSLRICGVLVLPS